MDVRSDLTRSITAKAELQLLLTSLSSPPKAECASTGLPAGQQLLHYIQDGHYTTVLQSPQAAPTVAPAAAAAAQSQEGQPPSPATPAIAPYFSAVGLAVSAAWRQAASGPSREMAALELLCVAVAALYTFLQTNLTGPKTELPDCPAELHASSAPARAPKASFGEDAVSAGDRWALQQLGANGEDPISHISAPQYLLLARTILLQPLGMRLDGDDSKDSANEPSNGSDGGPSIAEVLPSWRWWAARAVLTQQRLLVGRSAALHAALSRLMPQVIEDFEHNTALLGMEGTPDPVRAALRLEAAMVEQAYGRVAAGRQQLEAAGNLAGVSVALTGSMGLRTAHQVEAKPQLVLAMKRLSAQDSASAEQPAGGGEDSGDDAAELDAAAAGRADGGAGGGQEEADVLETPQLAAGQQRRLSSLEQAIALGWAAQVKKGTAQDELQPWEMAPYVEAVLGQPRSRPLIRSAARLHRSQHERTRTRTKQRALQQLQALVQAHEQAQPPVQARMAYAFAVRFPLRPALRRELGQQLVAMGLVGEAMALFEELELWDDLIVCYQLLGKKVQAEELIRKRLEATPDDARLWCALGDLTLDDGCYRAAWERSGGRSTRAQRSLARSALRRKDYASAVEYYEQALCINPLHPEGWFALGYAALKLQDYTRALQAFTRCAQIEPDNGDAWNNIAAVHLQQGRHREAYAALAEAVRFKRDSWQTWSNYAHAALRARHYQRSAWSAMQVLELTGGQKLEVEVLTALLDHLSQPADPQAAEDPASPGSDTYDALDDDSPLDIDSSALEGFTDTGISASSRAERHEQQQQQQQAAAAAEQRSRQQLLALVRDVLKQAAATAAAGDALWDLLAKYYKLEGSPESAKECLLKRVRGLQGLHWQDDPSRFEALAGAAMDLCREYMQGLEAGHSTKRELSSSRMQLRGIIKQAQDHFGENPAFSELQKLLQEVEIKEMQAA